MDSNFTDFFIFSSLKLIPSQTQCLHKGAKKQSFKCGGFYYSVGLQGTINKLPHFPYVDYISKPLVYFLSQVSGTSSASPILVRFFFFFLLFFFLSVTNNTL